ncbi:MAG: ferritin-like domain-containing protein [Clostridiales bacterium]|nr:ferritin-like domain-containing protein [Clostridiales bacterium]
MNNTVNVNEEIINLITVQYDITKKEISDYKALRGQLIDENDKNLLDSILIIKNKHLKMLADLYYRFKGERLTALKTDDEIGDTASESCLSAKLKEAVLAELENAETYRNLTADFLNRSVRDTFSEIMTDCQNNALRFSLLLTKYS